MFRSETAGMLPEQGGERFVRHLRPLSRNAASALSSYSSWVPFSVVKKALQKKKSTSSEAPSSTANLAYVETIEHSSVQPDCIVPYSKWIVTEPFFHGFQGEDTIPVATLVFHSVMSFSTCPSTPLLRESPTAQDDGVVPMP